MFIDKIGYLSIKAYGLQNQTTYHFNELQDLHGGAWVGGFYHLFSISTN